MTLYLYEWGDLVVVVETGMPEDPVQIGIGEDIDEAKSDLSDTPIQSAGRVPEDDALAWASNEGWFQGSELPTYVEEVEQ